MAGNQDSPHPHPPRCARHFSRCGNSVNRVVTVVGDCARGLALVSRARPNPAAASRTDPPRRRFFPFPIQLSGFSRPSSSRRCGRGGGRVRGCGWRSMPRGRYGGRGPAVCSIRCRRSRGRGCRSARRPAGSGDRWRARGRSQRAAARRPTAAPDDAAARGARPTRSSNSAALPRARRRATPAIICGSMTFSSAENSGSRWWNW